MNYFYAVNNEFFQSELQIPLFQNRKLKETNLSLYKSFVYQNKWKVEKIQKKKDNNYFIILRGNEISNNDIYFLADNEILRNFNDNLLTNYNSFTDTIPDYRANFKIFIKEGGFSSFQSDYPFNMVKKRGTILSSISSIANKNADKNFVLIKNIYEEPIQENFSAYLVNYKTKKIEEEYELKTNYTNCLAISNKLVKPEIFLVTKKFLGIPMYISIKDKFISFEHTHPPHTYILSKNLFIKVSELKKEVNEIIN